MPLEDFVADAPDIAARVMYELLGRRWVWPPVTTTDRVEIPSNQNFLILEGRPVIDVIECVLYRGTSPAEDLEYVVENKHRLRFTDIPQLHNSFCWGSSNSIEVTYTYGSPPPKEVEAAIEALTQELIMAYNGDEECALPERVQSLTRNGISIQFAADDFLEHGRTGIERVDSALRHFNPGNAKRRARVYSINNPPPRRRNTSQQAGS
ncbi:head-tail adaptor [Gordonia phage Phendrix]|uniref:Head-to-tail adaptor n=2 Tax=Godonkavirus TaxID=2733178 RepID=A0A4D6E237_9CAUD|nr:head-tail adaptor [Gordonia phage GodonK]YP_010649121.1 head-tail adaptor [Gordonia phage Phendrix]QBZ72698.1 head-to-tail adaptor [Gordonia phage GodonK]QDK02625.1 head-to-tail adaptor [Gordonia phage Phendrix]